jgi:disulfide bond formation protein DsbB
MSTKTELAVEAVRISPPVAVTGLSLYGISLQDWVLVATLVYTVVSLVFLIRDKIYIPWKVRNGSK